MREATIRPSDLQVGDTFCVPQSFGSPDWWTVVEPAPSWLYMIGSGHVAVRLVTVRPAESTHGPDEPVQRAIQTGADCVIKLDR